MESESEELKVTPEELEAELLPYRTYWCASCKKDRIGEEGDWVHLHKAGGHYWRRVLCICGKIIGYI